MEMSETEQFNTVPQIFINDSHIGGFDKLYSYFKPKFDFEKLIDVTSRITKNLNKVIDLNFYPVIETRRSNLLHRPIGYRCTRSCRCICYVQILI